MNEKYGLTVIHFAAEKNLERIAKSLIEIGANVNDCDKLGSSPLHKAAIHDSDKVSNLLIGAKADLNAIDKDGDTPTHNAAQYNSIKVMKQLISANADVSKVNKSGFCPLYFALKNKNEKMMKILSNCPSDKYEEALIEKDYELANRIENWMKIHSEMFEFYKSELENSNKPEIGELCLKTQKKFNLFPRNVE